MVVFLIMMEYRYGREKETNRFVGYGEDIYLVRIDNFFGWRVVRVKWY